MKNWIQFPLSEGISSRQAHADLPTGTYEREVSKNGFFGPASHLYHTHAPTAWEHIEGSLKPRAFDLTKIGTSSPTPWDAAPVLVNANCKIRWWLLQASMDHLVRNADGDELLFVHQGSGHLFCDYGHLEINEGDYILLPRGTQWRLEVIEPLKILLIEATNSHYYLPDKGLLGTHAIFDPAAFHIPKINDLFKDQQKSDKQWQVHVKRRQELSVITFSFNPLDAIGWHGNLASVKINWRDIRPVTSHRAHLPPSAHTTFTSDHFIVCTFCPRPIESDPGALKVPFYHSNDDYDEVLFYHRGNFFSRDNIHPGMVTFHPSGFIHGPHPGAFKAGKAASRVETDEVAVMIDTRDALEVTKVAVSVEDPNYVHSWKGEQYP